MTTRRFVTGLLALVALSAAVFTRDGVNAAFAKPAPASSITKLPIKRIDGRSKKKQAAPSASTPASPMKPCALARYAELQLKRQELAAKHGLGSAAFADEYATAKSKLVSNEALEAAGCNR